MENLQPALLWLASICGAIATITGIVKLIVKPFSDMNKRIEALEKRAEINQKKLVSDHESFQRQEEYNVLFIRTLAAIVKHCETNNNTGELKEIHKQLDAYIYKNSGSL